MHTIVVTGANRGLGLGLVRELLALKEVTRIYATTRNIEKSKDLTSIKDDRLKILEFDVVNDEAIKKAADRISAETPTGIDLLINNAGILNMYSLTGEEINRSTLNQQLEVNCTSVFILTQTLLPLLRLCSSTHGSAWVVNIGSIAGSVENAAAKGFPPLLPYSMSKAALNMFSRVAAAELEKDNISVMTMHPGWVQTDMGNACGPAPMTRLVNDHLSIKGETTELIGSSFTPPIAVPSYFLSLISEQDDVTLIARQN